MLYLFFIAIFLYNYVLTVGTDSVSFALILANTAKKWYNLSIAFFAEKDPQKYQKMEV